jgi:hypothetical protein
MAHAELTGIDYMLKIETCDSNDCDLNSGTYRPDFLRIGEIDTTDGEMKTKLYASPAYGREKPVNISGIANKPEIICALLECGGPIQLDSGEIVCGALAKLRKQI